MGCAAQAALSRCLSGAAAGRSNRARGRETQRPSRRRLASAATRADGGDRRSGLPVSMNVLVVAWCQFQARTTALAAALGAEAHYINDAPFGRSKLLTPLRYLARGAHMWRLLQRTSPRTLIVITAPVFAPMVGWLWCALHRRRLVVDCHPGALHFRRWRWARSIHRRLLRRARLALVHTPDDERLVNSWGARALFLPDDLAHENQAFRQARRANRSILVAGTFDPDEPIRALLAAAALVP